ncbi:MAG: gliding motility-associated C-terminal domain-containing protein [Chitinophagia bacterium]
MKKSKIKYLYLIIPKSLILRITFIFIILTNSLIVFTQPSCVDKNDFIISRNICDPYAVSFQTNASGLSSIFWDFGNGKTANGLKNPTVKYNYKRDYSVLMILNFGFCIDTVKKEITIDIPAERNLLLTNDTIICSGQSVSLFTNQQSDFCWSPITYLNDPLIPNPISTPAVDITYTFTSKVNSDNIIRNGDFSQGNLFFTSEYTYSPSTGVPDGVCFVGKDIKAWHPDFDSCKDHTSGNGNLLLINGSTKENVSVWKQTINVIPNTNYEFSTWLLSLYPSNPAKLQFSINGIKIGDIFEASTSTCEWKKFFTTWNSGNNRSAVISIINKNTIFSGNDFAIDDVYFGSVTYKYDSVNIKVRSDLNYSITSSQQICKGQPIILNASGGDIYDWEPIFSLNNSKVKNPIAKPLSTTTYFVKITDTTCNLVKTFSTTVSIKPFNPSINSDTSICEAQIVKLNSSGGNSYQWVANTTLSSLLISSPIAKPVNTTTYFLIVKDTLCKYVDTLSTTIRVLKLPNIRAVKSNDITCEIRESQLIASGGLKYTWSPSSSLNNSFIVNPIARPQSTTTYYVIGEGVNGCLNRDSILVNVLNLTDQQFFVPSAFTPNNDRLNDCFGITKWTNIQELEFSIYNRWGELIFFTKNKTVCWNGKYKGILQNSGTYIYTIKAKNGCDYPIFKKGTFVLIR